MKKRFMFLFGVIPILAGSIMLATCLNPIEFRPDFPNISVTGEINITDVTSAVLMLTNRSRTVDVTNVSITQPEWTPPEGSQGAVAPSVSFAGKPKRLEKKAQYLPPSDKSYCVVIDYKYDALNDMPAGTGTKTLCVPLPIPQQIVEYVIYRDTNGVIIVDKETVNPDPDDTGNPAIDSSPGEGSSPAEIPPEYRTRLAAFIVVNMTNSQAIDSVNFRKGESDYTMGGINIRDRQSIALSQGSWATWLYYTRNGVEKSIGPRNSIVVPSSDPMSLKEHYLYFYLNKRGDYAVTSTWPPFPNDVDEEDMLPTDAGNGRGMIEIVNQSYAMAGTVTIQDLTDTNKFPFTIDYDKFNPPVPVQYNKTGYVDVIGTPTFPIEAHGDYLIQIMLETANGSAIVERKAFIKDQVVTIVITADDLNFNNARGAKVTLYNNATIWPVDIINLTVRNKANSWQSSFYGTGTWEPNGDIAKGKSAYQYVMSSTAMPITKGAEFEALVTMHGNGVTATATIDIMQSAELYSESPPDRNTRTITVTDSNVPQSIKDKGVNDSDGAKVFLENKTSAWPVEIIGLTVRNKSKHTDSSYYGASTWEPNGSVIKGNSAYQYVMSTGAMPITERAEFEALVIINGSGKTETVIKQFTPPVLYMKGLPPEQNTRSLSIDDSDIPQSIKDAYIYTRGATVTISNITTSASPVDIISMTVRNRTNTSQRSFYSDNTWEPHVWIGSNGNAIQTVSSSPGMPITSSAEFEAVLYLFANNKRAEVIKTFNPAVLYADLEPSQNTRLIEITDSDVPPGLQPVVPPGGGGAGSVGAKVTLVNDITWPVQIIGMTVQNKTDNGKNTSYDWNTWSPNGRINNGGSANQMVYDSASMPINAGDRFEAVITLHYNGMTANVKKDFAPAGDLYSTTPTQHIRTVTVTDTDVPQAIVDTFNDTRGAKVTLQNRVKAEWPVQITEMTVRNKDNHSQKTDYNTAAWEPMTVVRNGQNAVLTVMTSNGMPIRSGYRFEAVIKVLGNGKTETIVKQFDPTPELYSTVDPSQNTRTVTINDIDIPDTVKPPIPGENVQDNIDKAKEGDTVVIDGVEWIKVRTSDTNSNLVLLMLKGVTGRCVPYSDSGRIIEYGNNPSIKGYVDTWYAALNSPTLKRIAWNVNFGSTPSASWPGNGLAGETHYTSVAFIPRLADITRLMKANTYRYWLSDMNQDKATLCWYGSVIKDNGDYATTGVITSLSNVYVRPCIWVTVK
jgi:hypothetical protein